MGFSTFWSANILTEMSDGQLRFCNLDVNADGLVYCNWLMLKSNQSLQAQKPFLLMNDEESLHWDEDYFSLWGEEYFNQRFRLVHTIDTFRIYEPIDLAAWRAELEASPSVP